MLILLLLLLLLFLLSLLTGLMVIFRSTLSPTIHITNKSAFKLTVEIWKSFMWTAGKDVNMKAIFAVMKTAWAVVKIRPKKIQACTGFEHDLCNTGRALHLYRTGHEFKSLTGMNFFQAVFLQLLRYFFLLKGKRPSSREGGAMPAEQPVWSSPWLGGRYLRVGFTINQRGSPDTNYVEESNPTS